MTTTTPPDAVQMQPLPVQSYDALGFGHTDYVLQRYAQAHAAQRTTELEARLAVADARVADMATVIYEHLQLINDAANTLSQNGWGVTADALFTSSKAIEAATKEHQ